MRHLIIIEGLSLDKNINRMMDLLTLITKNVDFNDLEIISKVLKYESSEIMNRISEFTGESLTEIAGSYISRPISSNNILKNSRIICGYAKEVLMTNRTKGIL